MLARSKAEALFLIRAYERESAKVGLVVKANSCIAPIGTETKMGTKSIESENVVRGRRINFWAIASRKIMFGCVKYEKELCPKGETNKKPET